MFIFFCYLIICLLLYLSIYEFWFILHYSFVTFCLSLYNVRAATYKTIITFVNIGYFSVTFSYHFCLNLNQETRFFLLRNLNGKILANTLEMNEAPQTVKSPDSP